MSVFSSFQSRSQLPEIMDEVSVSKADFLRAMSEIRWVNRYLGGTAAILKPLQTFCRSLPTSPTLTILDLGTASADIPCAIAKWLRQSERHFSLTAIDLHSTAVEEAQRYVAAYPEITVLQKDALQLLEWDVSYDFVISSMFLHHLTNDDAVHLLKTMAKLARKGFIINDLERHPLAWLEIRLLGWLTLKGKIFRYDSALSVKRAFTRDELKSLCHQAGLPQVQIHHRFPFRWVIVWQRPSDAASY